MKINNYCYKNYSLVNSYNYNNALKADIIILCQHGYSGKEFADNFPHLFLPLKKYQSKTVSCFLEIEHDYGARDVAFEIANILHQKLNSIVITVNCDRAIMDANRTEDHCITPFVLNSLSDTSINEIKLLNIFVRETILSILKENFNSEGYILDIHSMWPFNINIKYENISDINEFISKFLSPENQGTRREINFITHNANGKYIANEYLSLAIEQELKKKYHVKYNDPFHMLPIRSNYIYFTAFNGIAIDIPRNILGISQLNNSIDFSYMKKDKNSILSISDAIASGILKLFDLS